MTEPNNMLTVLAFIRAYVAEHQTGPLVTEIAAGCGLTLYQAYRCVHHLRAQKRIRMTWRQRSIAPIDVPADALKLSARRLREQEQARSPGKLRYD